MRAKSIIAGVLSLIAAALIAVPGLASVVVDSSKTGIGYFSNILVAGTAEVANLKTYGNVGWESAQGGTADVLLERDAAATLALRNSTTAQTIRVYNTYTDVSTYERGTLGWSSNVFVIGTEQATGTARNMAFRSGGTNRWEVQGSTGHLLASADASYDIGSTGGNRPRTGYFSTSVIAPSVQTGTSTVSSLSTCDSTNKGARKFATDANSTTFLATAAGGGANNVPVVCNGTNWVIGAANEGEYMAAG